MTSPTTPPDVHRRAFTAFEALVVAAIVSVLATMAIATGIALLDDSATRSIAGTLAQIDLDALTLAQQDGLVDPSGYLHAAVVAAELPQAEIDADTLRVAIDPVAGTVTLTRDGRCQQLTTSPTGNAGTITDCP